MCSQEAQSALNVSRSLRSKVQLAEQAQRQARGMEQDYEEVLHVLEQEVMELRNNQVAKDGVSISFLLPLPRSFGDPFWHVMNLEK